MQFVDSFVVIYMYPLSQEHNHQALVQLRNGVSTRKVAILVGRSQSYAMHLRKGIGGKIERQRGERPKPLADEKRGIVSLLLPKIDLELHMQQQNNFNMK